MGNAIFDGDEIARNAYIVPSGTSTPYITVYPRTIGGIIQESGVIEKTLALKSSWIVPDGKRRDDIEMFFHNLNEQIGRKTGSLTVHSNEYYNASVKNIEYDSFPTNRFCRYTINFILGDQNSDSSDIRQLSVPGLQNFTRGRKMYFETELEDGSYKTFEFWHNFDNVKHFDTEITVKHDRQFGGYARIIQVGGFERIVCYGWIIGPENIGNRQNLEAYFFNILNGPLGRVGTLTIGTQTIEKAFLTELRVEDSTNFALKYELTFLSSLQC